MKITQALQMDIMDMQMDTRTATAVNTKELRTAMVVDMPILMIVLGMVRMSMQLEGGVRSRSDGVGPARRAVRMEGAGEGRVRGGRGDVREMISLLYQCYTLLLTRFSSPKGFRIKSSRKKLYIYC